MPVSSILGYMSSGMTVEDMLREWPELEAEDIYEALGFAALSTEEEIFLPQGECCSMKFLLNMNLPRRLSGFLSEAGHTCRHAGDIGLAETPDRDIIVVAQGTGEVILTHDLDYGGLLAFSW